MVVFLGQEIIRIDHLDFFSLRNKNVSKSLKQSQNKSPTFSLLFNERSTNVTVLAVLSFLQLKEWNWLASPKRLQASSRHTDDVTVLPCDGLE